MSLVKTIRKSIKLYRKGKNPWPEGREGLGVRNYQSMVGGRWDELGPLQFDFMKGAGLQPEHVLCDVACGSFRAGRYFIEYLDPGNYLGIDKQAPLVDEGRKNAVSMDLWQKKNPEIVLSDTFEFEKFSKSPEFAIANSLFTHLGSKDIRLCLTRLFKKAAPGCRFYATFFESDVRVFHVHGSHSSRRFEYTRQQMLKFGTSAGWEAEYIGDWNHPARQVMVCYTKP